MSDCYVCLEECDHKSPCDCGQPVHKECLHDVRKYNIMCTICKRTYWDTEDTEDTEDTDSVEVKVGNRSICCLILLLPFIYVLSGLAGQIIMGLMGLPFGYHPLLFQVRTSMDFVYLLGTFNFFVSVMVVHVPLILSNIHKNTRV